MSGKLVIAVILALQVTVALSELPKPDPELVEKYNGLKEAFYKRLGLYFQKTKDALEPLVEQIPESEAAKEYVEVVKAKPHVVKAIKITEDLAGEMAPMVEKARESALGLYGHYMRPWAGEYLDQAIGHIRGFLDKVMPMDEQS